MAERYSRRKALVKFGMIGLSAASIINLGAAFYEDRQKKEAMQARQREYVRVIQDKISKEEIRKNIICSGNVYNPEKGTFFLNTPSNIIAVIISPIGEQRGKFGSMQSSDFNPKTHHVDELYINRTITGNNLTFSTYAITTPDTPIQFVQGGDNVITDSSSETTEDADFSTIDKVIADIKVGTIQSQQVEIFSQAKHLYDETIIQDDRIRQQFLRDCNNLCSSLINTLG